MRFILSIVVLFLLVHLVSCATTKPPAAPPVPVSVSSPSPTPAPTPLASPAPGVKTLAWGHPDWDQALYSAIEANFSKLEADVPGIVAFCPKYASFSHQQRLDMHAAMFVADAKFESGYDPKNVYQEPPPLNVKSIGLFQLSYESESGLCGLHGTGLMDPIININCGVKLVAKWIEADKTFNAGCNKATARGWSRSFSTTRTDNCGRVHKLDSIRAIVTKAVGC